MLLQEFYAEHGMFPKQKDVYKGVKLGLWGANQRRDVSTGKCLPERYAKLYEIGFLQSNTHDSHWEQNFQKLMHFLDEYDRFPIDNEVYQGVNIGKWCSNQKLHSKRSDYPKDRMLKLTRIGFFDTTRVAIWEQHYGTLQRFVEEYDRLPTRNESYEGFRIGSWCSEQKRQAANGNYSAYKAERLTAIGLLNQGSNILSWEQSFALLEAFLEEFGRFPAAKEQYQGYNLGNWCDAQKFLARNTEYDKDRMQKLTEIGIFSTTQDAKWEQHFALLEAFVAEYGRLPKQKELYHGEQIGVWCAMQKQRCKKPNYPAERIRKLTEIGLI